MPDEEDLREKACNFKEISEDFNGIEMSTSVKPGFREDLQEPDETRNTVVFDHAEKVKQTPTDLNKSNLKKPGNLIHTSDKSSMQTYLRGSGFSF